MHVLRTHFCRSQLDTDSMVCLVCFVFFELIMHLFSYQKKARKKTNLCKTKAIVFRKNSSALNSDTYNYKFMKNKNVLLGLFKLEYLQWNSRRFDCIQIVVCPEFENTSYTTFLPKTRCFLIWTVSLTKNCSNGIHRILKITFFFL